MVGRKAVYIEIRFDDGWVDRAEGKDAEEIMNWYASCETMNCIHGAAYKGPHFKSDVPDGFKKEKRK